MDERGVKVGMTAVDVDGKKLGKVTRNNRLGFEVMQGLFSPRTWVIRWDEVLGVEGNQVRVARSDETLFELAAGGFPKTWTRTPPSR